MKFEYGNSTEPKSPVAFIDSDDDLWVLRLGTWICVSDTYSEDCADVSGAIHKFYPGEKITITF